VSSDERVTFDRAGRWCGWPAQAELWEHRGRLASLDTSDEGGLGHCVIIAGPRLIGGVFLLLIGIALPRSGFLAKLARPSHRKFASIPTCTQRSSDCR
jgi:hypothetical protein